MPSATTERSPPSAESPRGRTADAEGERGRGAGRERAGKGMHPEPLVRDRGRRAVQRERAEVEVAADRDPDGVDRDRLAVHDAERAGHVGRLRLGAEVDGRTQRDGPGLGEARRSGRRPARSPRATRAARWRSRTRPRPSSGRQSIPRRRRPPPPPPARGVGRVRRGGRAMPEPLPERLDGAARRERRRDEGQGDHDDGPERHQPHEGRDSVAARPERRGGQHRPVGEPEHRVLQPDRPAPPHRDGERRRRPGGRRSGSARAPGGRARRRPGVRGARASSRRRRGAGAAPAPRPPSTRWTPTAAAIAIPTSTATPATSVATRAAKRAPSGAAVASSRASIPVDRSRHASSAPT